MFHSYRFHIAFQELKTTKVHDDIIFGLLRDGKTVQELEKLGLTADKVRETLSRRSLDKSDTDFSDAAKAINAAHGGLAVVTAPKAKARKKEFRSRAATPSPTPSRNTSPR